MTSLSVNLHARHGTAVAAITLGGSPAIIPILQRWKRRIGEVPSRPHMRGYRSRKEGVTLHASLQLVLDMPGSHQIELV